MRILRSLATPISLALVALSACECDPRLGELAPQLVVDPREVRLSNIGVAQDTPIVVTIRNPSFVTLNVVKVELIETDPAIQLREGWPEQVLSTGEGEVHLVVRPMVVSTFEGTLRITAEEAARPTNVVDVPIVIESADLGLPDILVEPDAVEFARIGQGDVVRAAVQVRNVGVRDLIIDEAYLESEEDPSPIRLATTIPADRPLTPQSAASLDLVFAPQDTLRHDAVLVIKSNDPDEQEIRVPVGGQGSQCPVAVARLLEDPATIEPLDTVRLDGHDSYTEDPTTSIAAYEWTLEQRPIGSTAVLTAPDADRTELTTDVAGTYVARLVVYDDTGEKGEPGVRSCNDALVTIQVRPTEALHVELVWDHPSADLDLHMVRGGGTIFNHDGDCYFSNREPAYSPETPGWSQNPDENPTLDADDNRGYGPENVNIVDPAADSTWRIYVHYWGANTDGDPFTVATLRVYVYGQLEAELTQNFDSDETLWQALEIRWPTEDLAPASITHLGVIETYPRPF